MREIEVTRDGDWLVITATRYRRDKEPAIKRTYLSMDEAAIVVQLLSKMLPPVTSAGEPS